MFQWIELVNFHTIAGSDSRALMKPHDSTRPLNQSPTDQPKPAPMPRLLVKKLRGSDPDQQRDALANCVFVAAGLAQGRRLACVNGLLMAVAERDYIEDGRVALNLLQREDLQAPVGSVVDLLWVRDESQLTPTTLSRLEVVLLNASEPITLTHSEVKRAIRRALADRPVQPIRYVVGVGSALLQFRVNSPLKHRGYYTLTEATELHLTNAHLYLKLLDDRPSAADVSLETLKDDLDVGGLRDQVATLYRRVFASRRLPPSVVKELQIQHVRGILLYGPPGCGKTLLARRLGQLLGCTTTTVVNGPELLNKYVGQSEENAREMFRKAQDDPHPSHLHLIICDEFDALCRRRGSGSSNDVGDNLVNTILAMLDGVNQLNNVLFIGLTNRKELIDEAILRPGRLEVHLYIGLPDTAGREEILRIHLRPYLESGRLSPQANPRWLAQQTVNYTGAELAGLVRNAASYAMLRADGGGGRTRARATGSNSEPDAESDESESGSGEFQLTQDDFRRAMLDQGPALANDTSQYQLTEPPRFSERVQRWLQQLPPPPAVIYVTGGPQHGKTQLALQVSRHYSIAYVRLLTADQFVAVPELTKAERLQECFQAAQTAGSGVIILDDWDLWLGSPLLGGLLETSLVALVKGAINRRQSLVVVLTATDESKLPKLPQVSSQFALQDDCLTDLT